MKIIRKKIDNWEDKSNELDFEKFFIKTLALVAMLFVCAFIPLCLVCATGCSTTIKHRNAGDIRNTDSYIVGGLESAVSDFDDGIGRAIRESRGIADEVDRLEFLFNRYEQYALRLRNEVDSLRKQIEGKDEGTLDRGDSSSD